MKIVSFSEIPCDVWNQLVVESPEAWLFHRAEWVNIERRFFAADCHAFGVIDDKGGLAAVCPLYLRTLGRGRWIERLLDSGHHRQAGPVFRAGLDAPTRKAASKFLMRHILAIAHDVDADRIQLNAHNLAPAVFADRTAEIPFWVREYGFQLGLHVAPQSDLALPGFATLSADQILDLDTAEDALFAGLDDSFRKACRKAQKAEVEVRLASGEPIEAYYALAEISAKRTGECLAAQEYYQAIWDAFAASGNCVLFFAHHEGRDAAALMMLVDKAGASYLAGVSHADFLPLRVNNFIHWEAIRALRTRGCLRYRLGPTFPELPADWPVSRVSRFKGEFGARSRSIIQTSLFLKPERYLEDAREALLLRCTPAGARQSA